MSKGIVLDCKFENYGGKYTCLVQNESLITTIDDRVITGIKGEHLEGKSDDDVTVFYATGTTIKFFPQNLTNFFKNIKWITIYNGKLQKITKEDLKEFDDKLEDLDLGKNEIEVLEADLFEFNRNLEDIFLSGNKIKRIEPKTFDGLEKLESLYLNSNPCTSENDNATYNRQEVLELTKKVEASCNEPLIAEKSEEILPLETLHESNKKCESLKLENEKLEAKLSAQSEEILIKTKENEDFKMENLKLIAKVNKLKENEDLKAFMTEQEEKLKSFIEAQISSKFNLQATKVSSLEDKVEKMKDLTSKSTNEVKNLIEGQISTFDAKMEMQTEKIIEDSKNAFNELKKNQKIFTEAQEKILNANIEKFNENLKHHNAELQEKFKELKTYIDTQNEANLLLINDKQHETLKLAEKINQILSKALDGTNKTSQEFEALSKLFIDTLRKFGARVDVLTSDLGNKIENNKSK